MNPIDIKINNITKAYGTQEVLKDISINIDSSSYYSICGKSGAGKSTFMNILGLIEGFDKGEYMFNGINISSGKDYYQLRQDNIGFIYQSYNLIPKINCIQNIIMPLIYKGVEHKDLSKKLREISKKLQIEHLLEKDSSLLSGGEKQRVAIARALITDPGLIIADEPTGNLDGINKAIVMDILREEHSKGRAIVIITHDDEVAAMTNEKYNLINGRLSK